MDWNEAQVSGFTGAALKSFKLKCLKAKEQTAEDEMQFTAYKFKQMKINQMS